MKSKFKLILLFFLILVSCEKQDDNLVPENLQVNNFIWKGLNLYYLWQADEPDLNDNRFENQKQLNSYLTNYSNPNDLFQHLLVNPVSEFPLAGQATDRFSVLYSNYLSLEGVLSGTTSNNGMDFGLKYKSVGSNEIFGWVRYVLPNSDAALKNVQRGMIFYGINGNTLTVDNYRDLLNLQSYTINLAEYNNGTITPNGQSILLSKSVLSENPVLLTNVIQNGLHKIGYLVYNGFYSAYEPQLNAAFGQLKAQEITEMVLDLRYNSGGSIATATRLASMITGQFNGQIFGKQQWNAKVQAYYQSNNPQQLVDVFTNTLGNGQAINSLNLTKIYILTSKSTASASELVINGLKPYINVIQIGDVTVGKNVGSITLYDSPTFTKTDINTKHQYAMQPLVLRIANKDGFGDYVNGLQPAITYIENLGSLGNLGSESEPLLSVAINQILTGNRINQLSFKKFDDFKNSKSINDIGTDMYLENIPAIK